MAMSTTDEVFFPLYAVSTIRCKSETNKKLLEEEKEGKQTLPRISTVGEKWRKSNIPKILPTFDFLAGVYG